jgi:hypothetical protein
MVVVVGKLRRLLLQKSKLKNRLPNRPPNRKKLRLKPPLKKLS